jgi:hypothetical protein
MRRRLHVVGVVVTSAACLLGCGSTASTDGGVPEDAGPSGNPIGLWVDGLYAYAATELGTSGSPGPTDSCPVPRNGASTSPAVFDSAGNLWAQQAADSTISIILWTAQQLAAACSSETPARTITIDQSGTRAALDQISAMAFDAEDTLWLSFQDDGVLLGLSSSQYQSSGTVVPTYTLQNGTSGAAQLYAPTGLAFDAAGNMWVGNVFSVLEYKTATLAAALTATGGSAVMPLPDAYLSTAASEAAAANGSPGTSPTFEYVAFDAEGNLWVSGAHDSTASYTDSIAEYAASALTALGTNTTPAPLVTLHEDSAQAANFVSFGALAFDSNANLWLGGGTELFRYPVASLAASGSGLYDVTISNIPFLTGYSLAFNPIPSGVPIRP